jgi:hypothetical protein
MEITLLLGIGVGIVLGLTGAGGGVLAVPALINGMGWSVQQAAPVALIAVAAGAALGAFEGLRKGLVRYKAAIVMVLCGLPFTKAGITVAQQLPQRWLLGLFAGVTLIVVIRLLRQTLSPERSAADDRALARIDPATGRFRWTWRTGGLFAGFGALTGFMTGLLGVGGGFVIVPAMRRYTNASMHGIVATSLMVIALVSSGGIAVAVANGAQLPWPATILFAVATALGMGAGRKLSSRLSEKTIQRGFALVLLGSAASMIVKATLAA